MIYIPMKSEEHRGSNFMCMSQDLQLQDNHIAVFSTRLNFPFLSPLHAHAFSAFLLCVLTWSIATI